MLLPNYDRAEIVQEKIVDYALNPDHPVGKHKAGIFKSVLKIDICIYSNEGFEAVKIELLDVVAVLKSFPNHNLVKGTVGTVVGILDDNHLEVEFSDKTGEAYASFAVNHTDLMVLRYEPLAV